MDESLVSDLYKVINSGISKSKIELDIGMPANCLSGYLSGSRGDLPIKWIEPLRKYMDKKLGIGQNKCDAGCVAFAGGEIRHHKDCVFYPDSLSKKYDEMDLEIVALRVENYELKNKSIAALPVKEPAKDKPPVTRNQPGALKVANDTLAEVLDEPKSKQLTKEQYKKLPFTEQRQYKNMYGEPK